MIKLRGAALASAFCASILSAHATDLTFEDRVRAQEAIERVYYSHQIGATRPFETAVPRELIERKVRTYLEESPIPAEVLERELARMTARTSMPERLLELQAALGNDPFVIQECLVRPRLAHRMEAPTDTLSARSFAPAIWTGSEMILWGGTATIGGAYLDTGLRYDPATDTWTATATTGAPSGRRSHTVVWTGDEMIVWGGFDGDRLGDGARYDPAANSWTAVSDHGPLGRSSHTALWTGTEMIVWGGSRGNGGFVATGARYDPAADTWTPTTVTGAPVKRAFHTAVWTGTEMIVWGGHFHAPRSDSGIGGRYDPATDTWTATSKGPTTRKNHTAVWTGTEMIIWGGSNRQDTLKVGWLYDPAANTWRNTPVATHGGRDMTGIWTGTHMLVWGGRHPSFQDGLIYDPATNTFALLRGGGDRPDGTKDYSAVWTGDRMIVWGGGTNTGGLYDPATNQWTATSTEGPAGQ